MGLEVAAGMAAAGIASSLIGASAANKISKRAMAQQKAIHDEMMARLNAIGIPAIEAQRIMLKDPQLAAELVPELAGELAQVNTAMGDLQADPELKGMQMDALSGIQQRAEGGLTPEDVIELNAIRRDATAGLKGQDASIMQNMEQRGLGGAGAELQQRMMAKQDAERAASEAGDRQAAQNYAAKMAALQQMGNVSTQMRGQDFGEQSQVASAKDAMAQFNVANRQRDIDRSNVAQAGNLSNQQNIMNAATGNRNQEQIHNKGLHQQKFNNEMAKATGQNALSQNLSNAAGQSGANQAANTSNMWSGIGSAVGGAAQMYGASQTADTNRAHEVNLANIKAGNKVK